MADVIAQRYSGLSCPAQIGLLLNVQSDLSTVFLSPQIQLLMWLMRDTVQRRQDIRPKMAKKMDGKQETVNKLKL